MSSRGCVAVLHIHGPEATDMILLLLDGDLEVDVLGQLLDAGPVLLVATREQQSTACLFTFTMFLTRAYRDAHTARHRASGEQPSRARGAHNTRHRASGWPQTPACRAHTSGNTGPGEQPIIVAVHGDQKNLREFAVDKGYLWIRRLP